jgi:hypothetical protein
LLTSLSLADRRTRATGDAVRHWRESSSSTNFAHDTIVCVRLAGLADGAGDAQPPLQLVAGVAQAGLKSRSASVRPAVGLACLARDVVRRITQCHHLLIGPTQLVRTEQDCCKVSVSGQK